MTAIFLALVVLFAWYEARRDARLIAEGKVIEHAWRWRFRAAVVILCAIPFVAPYGCGLTWLIPFKWALLCVASAFLFSACFRLFLNFRRGMDWRYVAPWSSTYDFAFYWLVSVVQLKWVTKKHAQWAKEFYFDMGCPRIHTAGLTACITELLITAAALVGMWYANK